MSYDTKAVFIFIDNSATSIDGDIPPSRLEAQKSTTERYSQYLFSLNPMSQVAVGTLAGSECGIRASFTTSPQKIVSAFKTITSVGTIDIEKGIRIGILAFKHCSPDIKDKRIMIFVCSQHTIKDETATKISSLIRQHSISIDLIIVGKEVNNIQTLKKMISNSAHSNCLEIKNINTVLSDEVLASRIGPGGQMQPVPLHLLASNDPDLQEALQLSLRKGPKQPEHSISNSSINMMLQEQPNKGDRKLRTKTIRKPRSTTKKKD